MSNVQVCSCMYLPIQSETVKVENVIPDTLFMRTKREHSIDPIIKSNR